MTAVALVVLLMAAVLGRPQVVPAEERQTVLLGDRSGEALKRADWALTADGTLVVVATRQPLLAIDRNGLRDIYVIDRRSGAVTLETPGAGGEPADGESWSPDISSDGNLIVFVTTARNLSPVRRASDVPAAYARDRRRGASAVVALRAAAPVITDDGKAIAYETTGPCGEPAAASVAPHICMTWLEGDRQLLLSAGRTEPSRTARVCRRRSTAAATVSCSRRPIGCCPHLRPSPRRRTRRST